MTQPLPPLFPDKQMIMLSTKNPLPDIATELPNIKTPIWLDVVP